MILFNPCVELDDPDNKLTDKDCDELLDELIEALESIVDKSKFSAKIRIIR